MDETGAARAAEAALAGTMPLDVKDCMVPLFKDLVGDAVPKVAGLA